MMGNTDDSIEKKDFDVPSPWTTEHNLVGSSVTRSILCPLSFSEQGKISGTEHNLCTEFYHFIQNEYPIVSFQQEESRVRKPALWRALIPPTSSSNPSCMHRASDTVPADWKVNYKKVQAEEQLKQIFHLPSSLAVSNVQNRLNPILDQTVVEDWLLPLVLTAVVEECQSQFLQQCIATQNQSFVNSASPENVSSNKINQSTNAPPYYRQPTSAYLSAPRNESNVQADNYSHSTLPVQFTPSQLVQRIKMGCSLAWQEYERQIPLQIQVKSSACNPLLERRSSSRLAQQQLQVLDGGDEEARNEWKVVTGGKVATFLRNSLILEQKPQGILSESKLLDENASTPLLSQQTTTDEKYEEADNGADEATAGKSEDEEFEEEDFGKKTMIGNLAAKNPYLQDMNGSILEWLGRKVAKFLTTADIQAIFPSLLRPTVKKGKKTQTKSGNMQRIGGDVMKYLSPIDQRIWNKMLANGHDLVGQGARFFFHIINDEDTTKIDEWETSSFGRCQFTVRIWNEVGEKEIAHRAQGGYIAAELEYREKKAWGTWRHKGINGGCTVFPSWLSAVEVLLKEQGSQITEMETEAVESTNDSNNNDVERLDDLAIAKSLAEQEASQGVGSTRRSRRSVTDGSGGVFYGTQSSLTQKQLMEALLRHVSLSSYQTTTALATSVLDSSSDPYRRMRNALGKLVWKRNQLCRLPVKSVWSDSLVWQALCQSSLITVDNQIARTLASTVTENEVDDLVEYVRYLHRTELRLREMVLECLADIPAAIIATSADEKPGSLECIDAADFEADGNDIEWRSSGHDLLHKLIFRPPVITVSDDITPCEWFRVVEFSDPVASATEDGDGHFDRPQIGMAKEATIVQRRRRFRVRSASNKTITCESHDLNNDRVLMLTEAQVHAGLKAAQLENNRISRSQKSQENPFAEIATAPVILVPPENSNASQMMGTVVGHDHFLDGDVFQHRILILPEAGLMRNEAVWGRLFFPEQGSLECQLENDSVVYTLQRFEYQPSSAAFQECRSIVEFLKRHPKSAPFLEPVDPVSLNVPDYFDYIKNPMDISTLSRNLESGKYSNIPPDQEKGRSSTARMLNGPFRIDVELIFDNAMIFNPPDDWIYQAALSLKRAVCKKIDQCVISAEGTYSRSREKHSLYVDDDSDVDLYEYESDPDEEYMSGKSRKRKHSAGRAQVKEDCSTRSIERPIRLHKVLSETAGLRGCLANLPINTDPTSFAIPKGWGCRRCTLDLKLNQEQHSNEDIELDELIDLKRITEEREASTKRRSTRTYREITEANGGDSNESVEYYTLNMDLQEKYCGQNQHMRWPRSRLEVELVCEQLHEDYFARLYQRLQKAIRTSAECYGAFLHGFFPPYLGHVVPDIACFSHPSVWENKISKWEIRNSYLIPAIRWIIRGLIRSGHLSELEPIDASTSAGSILPNHIYYVETNSTPFDVIDVRELTRKKKRTTDAAGGSSDEEVELSAYEKMRAERVARNAERLKALGLA